MSEINDGGPFHPMTKMEVGHPDMHKGVSVRDFFAAQALIGILCDASGRNTATAMAVEKNDEPANAIANIAYGLADAMLLARTKVKP